MNEDLFGYKSSPRESRADQIYKRFVKFHKANPNVWKLYIRFTFELINAGFEHYSSNAVFQRIRWHVNIETRSFDGLKLNDHYHAYYSRMFHVKFPKFDGFFRNRKRISAERPAYKSDVAYFLGEPPINEAKLLKQLMDLLEQTDREIK